MPALLDFKNLITYKLLTDYYVYFSFYFTFRLAKESIVNDCAISPICHSFCDFDQVQYKLEAEVAQEESNLVHISICISVPCFKQLDNIYSIKDEIRKFYPESNDIITGQDPNLKLIFKLSCNDENSVSFDLIDRISLLKRNLFSIPFFHAIAIQESGDDSNQTLMFTYRSDESVFIKPYSDRVVVIFQLRFKDQADTIFAKIFTQVNFHVALPFFRNLLMPENYLIYKIRLK